MNEVDDASSTAARRATERWTVNDALAWIAYRVAPRTLPRISYPTEGRYNSSAMMNALAARAAGACGIRSWPANGEPVVEQDDSTVPAYLVRRNVRRWMRETGLDAPALLDKARADLNRYQEERLACEKREHAINVALCDLNEAAREGWVTVKARPSETERKPLSRKPREVVPSITFDENRNIDRFGWIRIPWNGDFDKLWDLCIHDCGPFYYDVEFDAAQVREVWPESARLTGTAAERQAQEQFAPPSLQGADVEGVAAPIVTPAAAPPTPEIAPEAEPTKAKGGRPPTHDWGAFFLEVAWWGHANEFEPSHKFRPKLQHHMMQWCDQQWGAGVVDESTVRRKLKEFYDAGQRREKPREV